MIEKKEIGKLCIRLRRLQEAERRGTAKAADKEEAEHIIVKLNSIPGGDMLLHLRRLKENSGLIVL